MHVVGVDISKKDLHASNIENAPNAVPSPIQRFLQSAAGYRAFLKSIPDPASAIVVFESTGVYGRRMAQALEGHVRMLCQVNPRTITRFGCSMLSIKTDSVDAAALARIGGTLARERFDLLERQQIDLRPARADLELLLTVHARLSNMIAKQRTVRESIELHNSRLVDKQLQANAAMVKLLKKQRKEIRGQVVAAARELDATMFDLIASISGIGELTAAALVEKIRDISRFPSSESLKGYFGIHPTVYQSGNFKSSPRMASHGDAHLRRLLWNCAKCAAKHNPACHGLYTRLRARGRHQASAWGTVASKLICQVYGVLRSGKPFDRELNATIEVQAKEQPAS